MKEILLEDRILAKIKIFHANFRKAVEIGEKIGVGHVVFTFYSLCQSLWGSSAAVDSILNSIDSQDDSLVALESATLHLSKPIIDEIGILDHKKFQ